MHFTFNLALPGTWLSGSASAVVHNTGGGGRCLGLWQVLEGEEGCNDNADVSGPIVQRRGAGAGQDGGRLAGTEDPQRMDRRFGVKWG